MPSSSSSSSKGIPSKKKAHKRFDDDVNDLDDADADVDGHAVVEQVPETSIESNDQDSDDDDAPPEELDTVSAKKAIKARRRQLDA